MFCGDVKNGSGGTHSQTYISFIFLMPCQVILMHTRHTWVVLANVSKIRLWTSPSLLIMWLGSSTPHQRLPQPCHTQHKYIWVYIKQMLSSAILNLIDLYNCTCTISCNYTACFERCDSRLFEVNMADNGLVRAEAWSFFWQEHYSRVHVMSCHIRTLSPIPHLRPPWSPLTATMFHKCWHSGCRRHLSPLAFVLFHSAMSRPVLGCLMSHVWRTVTNGEGGKGQGAGWGTYRWRLWEEVGCVLLVVTVLTGSGKSYVSCWHSNQSRATTMLPWNAMLC